MPATSSTKPTSPEPGSPFTADDDRLDLESVVAARDGMIEVLRRFRATPDGVAALPKGLPKHVTQTAARATIEAWIRCRFKQATERKMPGAVEALIYGLEPSDAPVECALCHQVLPGLITRESVL